MVGAARGAGMAQAALAVVALAACVSAEQYGGGAMPQYGAADYERDYHARSPDAPAPLDYKYQEEPHGDSEKPPKFTEEVDRWRKLSGRVQRKSVRDDAEEELELESKPESEARSGRRWRKHRKRGRRDESRHEQLVQRRRPPLASPADRPARTDINRDQYLDSIDYRDDGNKYLEDNERIPTRQKPEKNIGRMPRQRIYAPPPLPEIPLKNNEDFMVDEEEEKIVPSMKDEHKDESDYLSGEERERPAPAGRTRPAAAGRMRATLPNVEPESGSGTDNEDAMREWRQPKPTESYPEYNDYRDMKNIENIKNKLPTLLRRPTSTTQTSSRMRFSAGRVNPWSGRRAGQLGTRPLEDLPAPRPTVAVERPSESPAESTSEFRNPTTTMLTFAKPADFSNTTPTTTTTSKDTTYAPVAFVPVLNGSELTMADKSRLSILKKAQMKESLGKGVTRKPPVLLHVSTRQVPTVVMVAPGTGDPWERAREVVGDSPATLTKVKRLMRQKLVSGAKDIRDLTDNWDETVCDYIDVGMLESLPDRAPSPPALGSLLGCVCCLCIFVL